MINMHIIKVKKKWEVVRGRSRIFKCHDIFPCYALLISPYLFKWSKRDKGLNICFCLSRTAYLLTLHVFDKFARSLTIRSRVKNFLLI